MTGPVVMAMLLGCTIIDLNGQTAAPQATLVHHVIVRADLPVGNQIAQCLHAAGESATPKPEPGCIAVALHARDEIHLRELSAKLTAADIGHHAVFEAEDDPKYPGQIMAIGIYPTTDRARVRRITSSLPLVR